jgi:hypothetical protein
MPPATKTRKRATKSKGPDIQQVDGKPVDTKPLIVPRDIVDMSVTNAQHDGYADVCDYCYAHRFMVSWYRKRTIFTPHASNCPVIPVVYGTSERLEEYASRKATFYAKYKGQTAG